MRRHDDTQTPTLSADRRRLSRDEIATHRHYGNPRFRGPRWALILAALPHLIARFLRGGDTVGALALLLGDETIFDRPLVCACNGARYHEGHMRTCPLFGLPPEVVVWTAAEDSLEFDVVGYYAPAEAA